MTRSPGPDGLWLGIMEEGRPVMERAREELQHEDLAKISIEAMESGPLKICRRSWGNGN